MPPVDEFCIDQRPRAEIDEQALFLCRLQIAGKVAEFRIPEEDIPLLRFMDEPCHRGRKGIPSCLFEQAHPVSPLLPRHAELRDLPADEKVSLPSDQKALVVEIKTSHNFSLFL